MHGMLIGFVLGAAAGGLLVWGLALPQEPPPTAPPMQEAAEVPPVRTQQTTTGDTSPRIPIEASAPKLEAELRRWKQYATNLENSAPQAALTLRLNVTSDDVNLWLDRSQFVHGAQDLRIAMLLMSPDEIKSAWELERDLYNALAVKKNECEASDQQEREMFHNTVYAPFLSAQAAILCQKLYDLHAPAELVEPFRERLLEGM